MNESFVALNKEKRVREQSRGKKKWKQKPDHEGFKSSDKNNVQDVEFGKFASGEHLYSACSSLKTKLENERPNSR